MKLISLLLFFCACNTAKQPPVAGDTDTISVKLNDSFTIRLSTSMGTGYSWSLADSSWARNMSLDSVTVVNNVEGKDDGPDTQVFYFRAITKSTSVLHFLHKRPWEQSGKINKEKKITVIIE